MKDNQWKGHKGVAEPNPEGRRIPRCSYSAYRPPKKRFWSLRWERRDAPGPGGVQHPLDDEDSRFLPRAS
jgi:hypothetical protein